MKLQTMSYRFTALVLALALTACGGGGGGSDPAPTMPVDPMAQENASASASWAGLLSFMLKQVASSTNDQSDARAVGGITPTVSETDDPSVI